jgi:hypothetical protein
MEVEITDLEQYVVIPDPSQDQARSVAETPYERVEIYWPTDLCKNGVEIIDSPGLNEHGTRTKITMDYLCTVDAVVFVMSCHALASQSEIQVIDNYVRGAGHEDIFFVCNRFDEIRDRDRDRLVDYGHRKLGEKTTLGADGIFFVSALDALDGRVKPDASLVERSGFPPFERSLARFLVYSRGRVKLLQPARELKRTLHEAIFEVIPSKRAMFDQDLHVLEQRYDTIKPELDNAERRRQQILATIAKKQARLQKDVRDQVSDRIRELARLIPEWAKELKTEHAVEFKDYLLPGTLKKKVADLAEEVVTNLSARIEAEQVTWQRGKLNCVLETWFSSLQEEIKNPVEHLLSGLDQMKIDLSGVKRAVDPDVKTAGGIERVLAAAGGFIVGGIGSAVVGGALGYKEMAKSLVPQIGIGIGMILLGVTNPWLIVVALFGAGIVQIMIDAKSMTDSMKIKIAAKMAQDLRESADAGAERVAAHVSEQTDKLAQSINAGIGKEIQAVREQVEAVLAAKKEGEERVQAKQRDLATCEAELKRLDAELTDVIFAIAEQR